MDPTDLLSSHSCRVNLARKSSLIGPKVVRTSIGIRISSSPWLRRTSGLPSARGRVRLWRSRQHATWKSAEKWARQLVCKFWSP